MTWSGRNAAENTSSFVTAIASPSLPDLGGARRRVLCHRLESERCRLVDVAENAAVPKEVDRNGQHRPLRTSRDIGPEHGHRAAGEEAMGDVVEVVVNRSDLSAALAVVCDGAGDIADQIDRH